MPNHPTRLFGMSRGQYQELTSRLTNGGRPPAFDREAYTTRNPVERSIKPLKQWCSIATRYDKLTVPYQATIRIARTSPD